VWDGTFSERRIEVLTIFLVVLAIIAIYVVSVYARAWLAAQQNPESWALAMDLVDLQKTGKIGTRSEAAKKVAMKKRATELTGILAEANKNIAKVMADAAKAYPTFPEAPGHVLTIEQLDLAMEYLSVEDRFKDIDETAKRYIIDLMAHDPRRWDGQLERKDEFMNNMSKNLLSYIASTSKLIENAYIYFDHPTTPNPSPEYRRAWDAKVEEWRRFIADR